MPNNEDFPYEKGDVVKDIAYHLKLVSGTIILHDFKLILSIKISFITNTYHHSELPFC